MSNEEILSYSLLCVNDERAMLWLKLKENLRATKNIYKELIKEKLHGK